MASKGITGTDMVISAKEAEIENLKSLPFEPDRYVLKPTGITVAEHWVMLNRAEKGSFMRDWHVRVLADKEGADITLGWLDADDEAFPVG
jgi:hypothetical protein